MEFVCTREPGAVFEAGGLNSILSFICNCEKVIHKVHMYVLHICNLYLLYFSMIDLTLSLKSVQFILIYSSDKCFGNGFLEKVTSNTI